MLNPTWRRGAGRGCRGPLTRTHTARNAAHRALPLVTQSEEFRRKVLYYWCAISLIPDHLHSRGISKRRKIRSPQPTAPSIQPALSSDAHGSSRVEREWLLFNTEISHPNFFPLKPYQHASDSIVSYNCNRH